jgi:hypothetical protein
MNYISLKENHMSTTASIHINRKNRKLIRRKIKKGFLNEAKKKIAQRAIEEAYQKRINATSIFDIASKEELKEIIYIAETNLPFIRLFEEKLSEDIYSGKYTNTQSKINKILKECNAVNNSGMLKESWAEFGLDMLFGLGPAIGDALAVPTGGASAIAGRGLAIAGMLYYGHKLAMAYKRNNTMDVFIHGLSFMFSAAAVFPAVGSAMAWVGKGVVTAIKAIFGPIFKGLAFGGKAVISGGASVKGAIAKKVGEKFLNPKVVQAIEETGTKVLQNSGKIETLAGMTETGVKYIDEFLGLASKAKPFLDKIPIVGSKLGPILDEILNILPKVSTTLSKQAGAIGKVAAVAEKEGLEAAATGALAAKAVASTAAEVKVATEVLETLAKESDELAAAAKQLGYLDEAFETASKLTTKGGTKTTAGTSGLYKVAEKGLGEFDVVVSKMATEAASVGKNVSGDAIELVQKEIFKAAEKLSKVGVKNKSTYASVTKIYKGLFQTAQDMAVITKTSMSSAIKELPKAAKTINFGNLKLTGQAVTKGGTNVVIKEIVEVEGKMMVKAIAKNGKIYSRELTGDIAKQIADKGIFKSVFSKMNKNLARQAKALERRSIKASFSKTAAKDAHAAALKASEKVQTQVVGELTGQVGEGGMQGAINAAADTITPDNAASVIQSFTAPEFLMKSDWWVKSTGSFWKTIVDSASTSHSSAPGAGSYNLQRESLLNNAIRLMEKRESIKNRQRKYTSLKLLY